MATAAELELLFRARDQASGTIKQVRSNLGSLHSEAGRGPGVFGALGNAIKGVGTIMAGVLGAQAIQGAIRGLQGLAMEGFNAVASYQKQTLAMQSMIAMELKQASAVERVIGTSTVRRGLTEKETASLEKLRAKQADYNSQLAIANQRLAERTGKEKTSAIMSQDAAYQKLLGNLRANEQAIAALEGKSGQLITTQQILAEETLSLADALKQASPLARELNDWIEQLAIKSPFGMEQVAGSLMLMKRYGFPLAEAKEITESMLNFAAATGLSNDKLQLISLALGQIRGKGRLMGQEANQLTEAGVGLWDILTRKMGKSQAQLMKMMEGGLLPAKEVIAVIVDYWGEWEGASEAAAKTLGGMVESLQDIKSISLRRLETGFFMALEPYISRFVDMMADPATQAKIEAFGNRIGDFTTDVVSLVSHVVRGGRLMEIAWDDYLPSDLASKAAKFTTALEGLRTSAENMLMGVRVSWQPLADALEALGVSPELAAKAAGVAASITGWIQGAWDKVKIAWTGGGLSGLWSMLTEQVGTGAQQLLTAIAGLGPQIQTAIESLWLGREVEIAGGAPGIPGMTERLGGFREALEGLGVPESVLSSLDGLATKVGAVATAVGEAATLLSSGDWKAAAETLGVPQYTIDAWNSIATAFGDAKDNAGGFATNIGDLATKLGGLGLDGIQQNLDTLNTSFTNINTSLGTLHGIITRDIIPALNQASGPLGEVRSEFEGMKANIQGIIDISPTVKAAFQGIGEVFATVWRTFLFPVSAGLLLISGTLNAIISAYNAAKALMGGGGGGGGMGVPNLPSVNPGAASRQSAGGLTIGAININASTERGGRAAARGFMDELQSRGFLGAR